MRVSWNAGVAVTSWRFLIGEAIDFRPQKLGPFTAYFDGSANAARRPDFRGFIWKVVV